MQLCIWFVSMREVMQRQGEAEMDYQAGADIPSWFISLFTSRKKVEEKEMESIPAPKGQDIKESTFQQRNINVRLYVCFSSGFVYAFRLFQWCGGGQSHHMLYGHISTFEGSCHPQGAPLDRIHSWGLGVMGCMWLILVNLMTYWENQPAIGKTWMQDPASSTSRSLPLSHFLLVIFTSCSIQDMSQALVPFLD